MNKVRRSALAKCEYHDPVPVLHEFRRKELELRTAGAPQELVRKRWRKADMKAIREARALAIFAYGLQASGIMSSVLVSFHEDSDYDGVLRWNNMHPPLYFPVQLKELTPDDVNPHTKLTSIIENLNKKYPDSRDLTVAIHYNRRERFPFSPSHHVSVSPVGHIWLFGGTSPDGNEWFLYGDLREEKPQFHQFSYP